MIHVTPLNQNPTKLHLINIPRDYAAPQLQHFDLLNNSLPKVRETHARTSQTRTPSLRVFSIPITKSHSPMRTSALFHSLSLSLPNRSIAALNTDVAPDNNNYSLTRPLARARLVVVFSTINHARIIRAKHHALGKSLLSCERGRRVIKSRGKWSKRVLMKIEVCVCAHNEVKGKTVKETETEREKDNARDFRGTAYMQFLFRR